MKIVTALDRSEYAEIVLEHGLDQATRHPSAELHFVTAIGDEREREDARRWLEAFVREGLDTFGQSERAFAVHVVDGPPAAAIAKLARDLGAELLVIGRFHVPSEAERMLWLVRCPVLVVGADGVELEPQCPACEDVRRRTNAEQLFCARHVSDRVHDLATRVSAIDPAAHRRWML